MHAPLQHSKASALPQAAWRKPLGLAILGMLAAAILAGCYATRQLGGRSNCEGCSPKCVPKSISRTTCYIPWYDDLVTRHTATTCANEALRQLEGSCGQAYSGDFRRGFKAAYIATARGSRPIVPAVPPPRYWNAYYRSCAGRQQAEDWLSGYEWGLQYSTQSCITDLRQVVDAGKTIHKAPIHYIRDPHVPVRPTGFAPGGFALPPAGLPGYSLPPTGHVEGPAIYPPTPYIQPQPIPLQQGTPSPPANGSQTLPGGIAPPPAALGFPPGTGPAR